MIENFRWIRELLGFHDKEDYQEYVWEYPWKRLGNFFKWLNTFILFLHLFTRINCSIIFIDRPRILKYGNKSKYYKINYSVKNSPFWTI